MPFIRPETRARWTGVLLRWMARALELPLLGGVLARLALRPLTRRLARPAPGAER